jgi:DNA-binding MarR family transcriptional regulator
MTMGKLAAAEQVKAPTTSRIVTGLEHRRLAERIPDSKDGRRVRIRATRSGVRLLQKGRRLRIEYLARHLDKLTMQELTTLVEAADVLEEVLRDWSSDE